MKRNLFLSIALIAIGISSCKKDSTKTDPDLPTVTTAAVTAVGSTVAVSGGNVTSQGIDSVTARGVCWSTSANPSTSDSKTTNASGLGSFASNLTGLSGSTTYHVRAYATNSKGTGYGDDLSFTTSVNLTGQSFSASVNGSPWTATNDNIYDFYQASGVYGQTMQITAYHSTNGSRFAFPFPYFLGSDTTFNYPGGPILLYQTGSYNYNQKTGSLHMVKSISGGIETITGDFSGSWKDGLSSSTISITSGQFVAKRQL